MRKQDVQALLVSTILFLAAGLVMWMLVYPSFANKNIIQTKSHFVFASSSNRSVHMSLTQKQTVYPDVGGLFPFWDACIVDNQVYKFHVETRVDDYQSKIYSFLRKSGQLRYVVTTVKPDGERIVTLVKDTYAVQEICPTSH